MNQGFDPFERSGLSREASPVRGSPQRSVSHGSPVRPTRVRSPSPARSPRARKTKKKNEYVQCPYCKKDVGSTVLDKHFNASHQEFFRCRRCGTQCGSRSKLDEHTYKVHHVWSYKCEICDEPFIYNHFLLKHLKTHHALSN